MMSTWRALLVVVVVSGVFASGQNTSRSDHGDRTLLIALENSWNQAQLHHDSKALDELVADTFVSTDNDGNFQNKAEFLADNRDTSYAPTLMANSDERVFFYDNTAVVAGVYHAKGTSKGKPFDHYGRFTDTWVFTKGKWLCVASHTSNLKKGR
jgi:Domain of unknown function (DUF4440)